MVVEIGGVVARLHGVGVVDCVRVPHKGRIVGKPISVPSLKLDLGVLHVVPVVASVAKEAAVEGDANADGVVDPVRAVGRGEHDRADGGGAGTGCVTLGQVGCPDMCRHRRRRRCCQCESGDCHGKHGDRQGPRAATSSRHCGKRPRRAGDALRPNLCCGGRSCQDVPTYMSHDLVCLPRAPPPRNPI